MIDRETGETIEFTTGRWNYNRDIASRSFGCASYRWDDTEGKYLFETWPDNSNTRWYHPYNGGDSILISYKGSDGDVGSTESYSIDNGVVDWFTPFNRRYMELTSSELGFSFRHWGETDESYRGCSVGLIWGSDNSGFRPSLPLASYVTPDTGDDDSPGDDSGDLVTPQESDNGVGETGLEDSTERRPQNGGGSFWLPLLLLITLKAQGTRRSHVA